MPSPKTSWVVCDDYAAGPYTAERAERELAWITSKNKRYACPLDHVIVISKTKPDVHNYKD